jgi:sigma-B regulation protein RsbU (phosphoserine phosphatase)
MTWKPGNRLVFFTDGVVDARNEAGDRLTEEAVLGTLAHVPQGATPDDILSRVFTHLETHVGQTPLRDDCTVVVVDRP